MVFGDESEGLEVKGVANMMRHLSLLGLAPIGQWSIVEFIIAAIIVIAVIAVLFIYLRAQGVTLPPWIIQIFWVVVAAFVAIIAIRFLMSM